MPFNIKKRYNQTPVLTSISLSPKQAKEKLIKKINKQETKLKNNNIKILSKQIIKDKLFNNNYLIIIKYITEQDIAKSQEIIFNSN